MPPAEDSSQQTSRAVLELRREKLTVSKSDGEQIRAALLLRLKSSTLEDAAQLYTWTRGAGVEVQADALEIGGWGLFADGDELRLMYRFPPVPAGIKAYSATVTKQAGWQVSEVRLMHIHARR